MWGLRMQEKPATTIQSPVAVENKASCEQEGSAASKVYSLFGADASSLGPDLLWQAGVGNAAVTPHPADDPCYQGGNSNYSNSFNPADDPRIDIIATSSGGSLAQLRALRELANSNCAGIAVAAGGIHQQQQQQVYYDAACCGSMQSPLLDRHSIQLLEHSLLQQAYLPPPPGPQTVSGFALHHSPAHSTGAGSCCDTLLPHLGATPEHHHLSRQPMYAEPPRSPHILMTNKFMAMPMHSPQPCMHSWTEAVRTSSSAPSSPAAAGGMCARDLFVPAGQQPPPPPRAGPLMLPPPPPPPPPPRRNFSGSSAGASSGPGTPQTPGLLQPFGIAPGIVPSLLQQDRHAQVPMPSVNPSCSSAQRAGSLSHAPSATQCGLHAASSFGRLVQGTCSNDDGLSSLQHDPFVLGSLAPPAVRIGTAAVLDHNSHSTGGMAGPPLAAGRLSTAGVPPGAAAGASATLLAQHHAAGPGTPTAPMSMLAAGRHSITASRLARSSSGTGSYHSCVSDGLEAAGTAPLSRLSSSAGGAACAPPPGGSSSAPAASAQPAAAIPASQLMYMEMHDTECSQYCLGGNLEPHKMWFGVGVHRAIRKLVSNNKKRHSLILALHAAGDGTGYGDLGQVYAAVKHMYESLASGTGWTSEAGARLFAGVDELRDLLETALREGPGVEPYAPPAFLKPAAR